MTRNGAIHCDAVLCADEEQQRLTGLICQTTGETCRQYFSDRYISLILTGSMARDEATFIRTGKSYSALSDADFLLIFCRSERLPAEAETQSVGRTIESCLKRHGITCSISLSAVPQVFLKQLKPHLFAHELRAHGRVVSGDAGIISLIPDFSVQDIPLEDGWRLLGNRMIELLEVSTQLLDNPEVLPLEVYYRTSKLYLDMATSFLLYQGSYQTTYRGRAEVMRQLANRGQDSECLDFPRRIIARLTDAMKCKQRGAFREDPNDRTDQDISYWREAIEQVSLLWRWELARLTGGDTGQSARELMAMWMARQSAGTTFRGWAYVVRECGASERVRNGFRWSRMALRGSPRYFIYGVAAELLFHMPALVDAELGGSEGGLEPDELRRRLPVQGAPEGQPFWSYLVSDIASNYHRFLEHTRA